MSKPERVRGAPPTEGWYHVTHYNSYGKYWDFGVQYCRINEQGWWYSSHQNAEAPRHDNQTSGLIHPELDVLFIATPVKDKDTHTGEADALG